MLLTSGRGEHQVAVELRYLDRDQNWERPLWVVGPRGLDLGQDPTAVQGLPIRFTNVVFERPGQYTFYFLCDGNELAHYHLEVR